MMTRRAWRHSIGPFADRLKYQLDFPGLKCSDCQEAYAEGELADADGKLIYDGGCPPDLFRCSDCPYTLYGEIDEISQLAQTIWNLMCQPLVPDHPPPPDFYFRLMGIRVGSQKSREIYVRMLELHRILKEHQELEKGDPQDAATTDPED
jgi:hypothetical protein